MNLLDQLAGNQNAGTPTLAGAGEGKLLTTSRSILDIFGKAADVVVKAKDGFEGRTTDISGAKASEPGKTVTQQAESFFSKYKLWIGVGAVALIGIIFFARR